MYYTYNSIRGRVKSDLGNERQQPPRGEINYTDCCVIGFLSRYLCVCVQLRTRVQHPIFDYSDTPVNSKHKRLPVVALGEMKIITNCMRDFARHYIDKCMMMVHAIIYYIIYVGTI